MHAPAPPPPPCAHPQGENQRLAVVEATFKRLDAQAREERTAHGQREHGLEMLQMDKAYLSSQVGEGGAV